MNIPNLLLAKPKQFQQLLLFKIESEQKAELEERKKKTFVSE